MSASARELSQALVAIMDSTSLPRGYSWSEESQSSEVQAQLEELLSASLLSIVLVFLLMGILFESVILPGAILATVPFALLGAFWSLRLFHGSIDIMAGIGMLLLCGIVVNNGIVLVDHINNLRMDGMARNEAIQQFNGPLEPYALSYDKLDIADRAAALEQGHPPFAGVFSLGAALDVVQEIGIQRIAQRIIELTQYLHERLDAAGIWVLSTRAEAHLSGITVASADDPVATVKRLREAGIVVSTRGQGIRASVHYYNNEQDVDRLVDALSAV